MKYFDKNNFLNKLSIISSNNYFSKFSNSYDTYNVLNYGYISAYALSYFLVYNDQICTNYPKNIKFTKKLIRYTLISIYDNNDETYKYLKYIIEDTLNVFTANIYTYNEYSKISIKIIVNILQYSLEYLDKIRLYN
jgi:hypothetical protein